MHHRLPKQHHLFEIHDFAISMMIIHHTDGKNLLFPVYPGLMNLQQKVPQSSLSVGELVADVTQITRV